MISRSSPTWLVALAILGLGLATATWYQRAAACSADLRAAEQEVRQARATLEKIVGPKLLRAKPPPLPELLQMKSTGLDRTLLDHLWETPPEDWGTDDRVRLEELTPLDLHLRTAMAAEGEVVVTKELLERATSLLRATRILAVRDRLALLHGEEAVFVDGVELRADLAERLSLQPGAPGPLFGATVFRSVLLDVHRLVHLAATSREVLERLETVLALRRHGAPDAASVVAREGLLILERGEKSLHPPAEMHRAGDPSLAPVARAFAELAGRCRAEGCQPAVAALRSRWATASDVDRAAEPLLIPNLASVVERLEADSVLTELAWTAVMLRLEALTLGTYPAGLDPLTTQLAAGGRSAAGWVYERRPGGGARLSLATDGLVFLWPEHQQDELRRLLEWELPPTGAEIPTVSRLRRSPQDRAGH